MDVKIGNFNDSRRHINEPASLYRYLASVVFRKVPVLNYFKKFTCNGTRIPTAQPMWFDEELVWVRLRCLERSSFCSLCDCVLESPRSLPRPIESRRWSLGLSRSDGHEVSWRFLLISVRGRWAGNVGLWLAPSIKHFHCSDPGTRIRRTSTQQWSLDPFLPPRG